jgi:hypothetical protein
MVTHSDLSAIPMAELRESRTTARRALELVRMRSHVGDADAVARVDELRDQVDALTAELIRRYAADLTLVDSLLSGTYARSVTSDWTSTGHRVGES